ncbi:PAS domain S-box protein [Lyngbya aestuarii]|uniref:PAS domain S-box protein n=1 Tax=Lyngbya aestuarii TaxID=118322 RepID=UPI00403D5A67
MSRKKVTFRLPEDLIQEIETRALATARDRTAVVVEILRQGVSQTDEQVLDVVQTLLKRVEELEEKIASLNQHSAELTPRSPSNSVVIASNNSWENTSLLLPRQASAEQKADMHLPQVLQGRATQPQLEDGDGSLLPAKDLTSNIARTFEETQQSLLTFRIEQQAKIFDQALSASPDLIFMIDRAGRFTYVNLALAQLVRLEQRQILGKTWQQLCLPSDFMEPIDTRREQVFATKQTSTHEMSYPTNLGRKMYEFTLSPIVGISSNTEAIICIAREITKRNQVQAALQDSEAKYRNLFESANDAIFIIDAESLRILNGNWNAARRLGYTPTELLNLSVQDIDAPSVVQKNAEIIKKLRAKGSIVFEHLHRHKNGTLIPVEISSRMIEYEGRLAFQNFVRDISERKQSEEQLRLLELAVFNANEAVLITEAESLNHPGPKIVYVNSGFTKMTGYQPEDVIGKTPRLLQGPKTNRAQLDKIRKALSQWEPIQVELINYRQDGSEFWVSMNIVPFANEHGWYTHFMAVQHDITQQKQLELQLQQSEERFRTSVENMLECFAIYSAMRNQAGQIVDFKIEYLNPAASDCYYLTQEEQAEQYSFQLLPTQLFAEYSRVVETGEPLMKESLIYEELNGKKHLSYAFDFRAVKLGDGFVVTWRDITKRKRFEDDLHRTQERLQHLLNFSPAIFYACQPTGDYALTFVSKNVQSILGYEIREFLQDCRFFFKHIHPEDAQHYLRAVNDLFERGHITYKYRFQHQNGEYRWLRDEARIVLDSKGEPLEITGSLIDITEENPEH